MRMEKILRRVFRAAAVYNFSWGVATVLYPNLFFEIFGLPPINYPFVMSGLGMCIALYAVACDEVNQFAAWLAETMSSVAGDHDHCASDCVHPDASSQAALEKERRFRRKYRVISASDIAFSMRFGGTPPFWAISTPQCM